MSDPLRTLGEANPVPRESGVLTPAEDARLTQMVQSRVARRLRVGGPAIALASALVVVTSFVWLLLVETGPPPPETTVAVAEAITTTTPATTPTSTTPTTSATTSTSTTTTTPASVPPVAIEWTRIDVPDGPALMRAISLLGDGYVAVGWAGSTADGDAAVWLSPDGVVWNRVPDDGSIFGGEGFQNALDVVVDGDRVVVVGLTGPSGHPCEAPVVWLSEDAGETWRRIEPGGPGCMWSVAMVDDGFVAGGFGFWHSDDGVDWVRSEDGVGVAYVAGMAASPGELVAVGGPADGEIQSAVAVSETGVVWERIPHEDALFGEPDPGTGQNRLRTGMNDVVWTGERFVAVGYYAEASNLDGAVWLSDDGRSWSLVTDPALGGSGSQFVSAVVSDGARLYAVGRLQRQDGRGQALAWVSTDGGSSWRAAESVGSGFGSPIPVEVSPIDVMVDGSRLIAVGYLGDAAVVWVGAIDE